jgi:hypothetical protein
VLRKIFGRKRNEVAEEWRKVHNEELFDSYSSPNVIRVIKKNEVGGVYSTYGREEKFIQGFSARSEGKRSLGRAGHRWEEILKWIFKK